MHVCMYACMYIYIYIYTPTSPTPKHTEGTTMPIVKLIPCKYAHTRYATDK